MNIAFHKQADGRLRMQFLNCTLDLTVKPGLQVVSSGCGSGKSTMISKIVYKLFALKILIVCQTIEAMEELASKLTPLRSVRVLHSAPSRITEMMEYKESPASLGMYDVLLVTAARLIIDPYPLFTSSRDLVLIDEMISFYPQPFSLPREFCDISTYIDLCKTHQGKIGKPVEIGGKKYYRHTYQTADQIVAAYKVSKFNLFCGNTALNYYKLNYLCQHVVENGLVPLHNTIRHIAEETCVVLFDGTAECIFGDKDARVVPVEGYKYNSDIEFSQFEIKLRRKKVGEWTKTDIDTYCKPLTSLLKNTNGKSLIVTWKTLDVVALTKNDGDADKFEARRIIGQHEFPEPLKEYLIGQGVGADSFSVIYRGSGEDRASNNYRDSENVIFLGEWHLPDSIVGEINHMFGCWCKFEDYMLSQMVQTICRSRIRLHQGLPIKVYWSNDISYRLMLSVQEYFKLNSPDCCKIGGIQGACKYWSKPEKKRILELTSLYSFDPEIRSAIEAEREYTFTISLDELCKLIPKGRKAKDRYNGLVNYLNKRGITMNIS